MPSRAILPLPRRFAGLALLLLAGEVGVWSLSPLKAAVDPAWFWGLMLLRLWVGVRLVQGGLRPRRLYPALRGFAGAAFFNGALLSTAVWRWYACAESGAGGLSARCADVFSSPSPLSSVAFAEFGISLFAGGNLLGLWQAAPPPWAYLLAGYSVVQLAVLSLLLPRSRNF